jgi:hypothetical protein
MRVLRLITGLTFIRFGINAEGFRSTRERSRQSGDPRADSALRSDVPFGWRDRMGRSINSLHKRYAS